MSAEREAWRGRALRLVSGYRDLLAPLGLAPSPSLRVETDGHPCPGYTHDDLTIRFCPPVVETPVDRLRWTLFCGYMGCADVPEAVAFYDDALPLVVAHELAHHLRLSSALASPSPFIEEQVCDRLAVALLEAGPGARSVPALRAWCERLRRRLDARHAAGPGAGFVHDEGALVEGSLGGERLAELRAAAGRAGLPVAALLRAGGGPAADELVAATQARERARVYTELHYTSDPSAYWHLSLRWLEGYLAQRPREGLVEALNHHLAPTEPLSPGTLDALTRDFLDPGDPLRQRAAVAALLEASGPPALAGLVDRLDALPDPLRPAAAAALTAAVQRASRRPWPPDALAHLAAVARREAHDGPTAARALRMAALAGSPARSVRPTRGDRGDRRADSDPASAPPLPDADHPAVRRERLCAAPDQHDDALAGALRAAARRDGDLCDWLEALLDAGRTPGPRALAQLASLAPGRRSAAPLLELSRRLGLAAGGLDALAAGALRTASSATDLRLVDAALGHLARRPAGVLALADPLPRRGLEAHAAATRALGPVGRGLRAAAARAAHAGREPGDDPDTLALARAALAEAEELTALARALASLAPGSPGAALADEARRSALAAARRSGLEIVCALAPREGAATVARLAEAHAGEAPPGAVVELLAAAAPAGLRSRLAAVLAGEARRPAGSLLSPSALGASTLLALALPVLAAPPPARYAAGPVLSLVERLVALRSAPLFEQVPGEALLRLAELTVAVHHPAGAMLFRAGDPGDAMFVLQRGRVRIQRGEGPTAVELAELSPPACIGEVAVLDGHPRSASALALDDCDLLWIEGAAVRRVGHENPSFYEALLAVVTARLRHLTG